MRLFTPNNSQMVAALRDEHPELQTLGFVKALAEAFPEFDIGDWFRRIPDAYTIRIAEREVDVFEVEVTHPLPRDTMRDLCRLWFELDSDEILMRLYVVNRYGHINEIDTQAWWYDLRVDLVPVAG